MTIVIYALNKKENKFYILINDLLKLSFDNFKKIKLVRS